MGVFEARAASEGAVEVCTASQWGVTCDVRWQVAREVAALSEARDTLCLLCKFLPTLCRDDYCAAERYCTAERHCTAE